MRISVWAEVEPRIETSARARRSALLDLDAGHLAQGIVARESAAPRYLMLDDGRRGADLVERLRHPRRRHHDDHLWQFRRAPRRGSEVFAGEPTLAMCGRAVLSALSIALASTVQASVAA